MAFQYLFAADVLQDLKDVILPDGQYAILCGNSSWGDAPAMIYQYQASASASESYPNVIKPTLQTGNGRYIRTDFKQLPSNWSQAVTSALDYIQNKPNLATVATSGSYNDLSNKPSIPAAQVNTDWNSVSGVSQLLNKPTIPLIPGSTNFSGYGTGTAYTLTTSSAQIAFGTTSPSITLTSAGTYLILANVTVDYSGLTTVSVAAANFKMRRTNNTAADIANTSQNFNVPIVTLLTQTAGDIDIPAVIYTTSNTNDIIQLFGNRGAVSVGSIQVTNAYIVAVKIA